MDTLFHLLFIDRIASLHIGPAGCINAKAAPHAGERGRSYLRLHRIVDSRSQLTPYAGPVIETVCPCPQLEVDRAVSKANKQTLRLRVLQNIRVCKCTVTSIFITSPGGAL